MEVNHAIYSTQGTGDCFSRGVVGLIVQNSIIPLSDSLTYTSRSTLTRSSATGNLERRDSDAESIRER